MVTGTAVHSDADARAIVRALPDPEMPWVTLGDLGVVHAVHGGATGSVRVELTPTYLGCPAIEAMRGDAAKALTAAGYRVESVDLRFDPPWTPASITEEGRRKLEDAGIAPPAHLNMNSDTDTDTDGGAVRTRRSATPVSLGVRCPRCGSVETALLSRFGASPCQELRRCSACAEPFPAVRS
jgi:ring-1,2-phenylacetyl-CoA epoxidase subunit PaaD